MALDSEPRLLVLHAGRLKGYADTDAIALSTALRSDVVAAHLAEAESAGWVKHRRGHRPGWMLTAEGRAEDERRLAAELDAAGARPAVTHAYDRFRALNADLLATCTAWQTGSDQPGPDQPRPDQRGQGGADRADPSHTDPSHTDPSHSDRERGRAVIERLGSLHRAAAPIADDLAAVLSRFAPYRRRLDHAWHRVEAGEHSWFTQPGIDSYHTVWFELHEDLLSTLGIARRQEAA